MNDKPNVTYKGISFFGVLIIVATAIFTVLKLIGKITWSWWWVLSPLWIGASIWLLMVISLAVIISHINRGDY